MVHWVRFQASSLTSKRAHFTGLTDRQAACKRLFGTRGLRDFRRQRRCRSGRFRSVLPTLSSLLF